MVPLPAVDLEKFEAIATNVSYMSWYKARSTLTVEATISNLIGKLVPWLQ